MLIVKISGKDQKINILELRGPFLSENIFRKDGPSRS